jgi:hypothetical protein
MDFEFDKEIDSLLRRAAKGESVQAFDAHPEADEISLFAENVLTAKARARTVEHLAECAKCRKILSNLISFNAEAESETIHAGESSIISVAPVIPWYRRLFAFPQITFAMGALALVFAGVLAFMVLQNAGETSQNTTVARREEISEKSKGVSGASADGETQTVENYSADSNTASVNPAAPVNPSLSTANSAANLKNTNTASTADATLPAARQQQMTPENNEPLAKIEQPKPVAPSEQQQTVTTTSRPAEMVAGAPKDSKQQQQQPPPPASQVRKEEDSERKRAVTGDDRDDSTKSDGSETESLRAKKTADADKNKAGEAGRSVGGKIFRKLGGIWFDAAYTSQPQIMIRRGSDDYKRLDSGVRSIADNLGGKVVIVWKNKAYRIQ